MRCGKKILAWQETRSAKDKKSYKPKSNMHPVTHGIVWGLVMVDSECNGRCCVRGEGLGVGWDVVGMDITYSALVCLLHGT